MVDSPASTVSALGPETLLAVAFAGGAGSFKRAIGAGGIKRYNYMCFEAPNVVDGITGRLLCLVVAATLGVDAESFVVAR